MEVGGRRGMMMGFAPFPASSSSHQRSLFHRALLKGDSGLLIISGCPCQYNQPFTNHSRECWNKSDGEL